MFNMPTPKVDKPPAPPRRDQGVFDQTIFKRRQAGTSGIVSTFLGGAKGEPSTVGKLGLTGSGY